MKEQDKRSLTWQNLRKQRLSGIAAATALGRGRSATDIVKISRMLNNPDPAVREGTIKNLAQIGGRDAAMAIANGLKDPDLQVRTTACKALGQMRAHVAKDKLYDALYDDNPNVSCAAAGALATMGDKIGLPQVMKHLCQPGRHQWEALRSLNQLTGQNYRINEYGLNQAIRWVRERKRRFFRKS